MKILIAEDDIVGQRILKQAFLTWGYKVTLVTNGLEALTVLEQEDAPELAILDWIMPKMDGVEVCQKIKQTKRDIPTYIILMSGKTGTEDIVTGLEAGADDYLIKPINREELHARVRVGERVLEMQRNLAKRVAELAKKNEELIKSYKETNLIFSAFSDLLPGTVLDGKYLLENKIGTGGYGVVYCGKHLRLNRPVAVKVFRPIAGNDSVESLQRFNLEGVSACRVDHPNAVSILDSGVSKENVAYLVMELLNGCTLGNLLSREKTLSVNRSIDVLLPICDVLAQAHQVGIVHRDIKPDNIFLHQTQEGEIVKLVDFGIAKLFDENSSNSQKMAITQGIIGTPHYLSPERLMDLPYDGKSDIYSLGIMFYEMLCGDKPFQLTNCSNIEVAVAHLNNTPIQIRQINPTIPENIETLLTQLLAKKPTKRPTAKQLFQKLVAIKSMIEQEPNKSSTPLLHNYLLTDTQIGLEPTMGIDQIPHDLTKTNQTTNAVTQTETNVTCKDRFN